MSKTLKLKIVTALQDKLTGPLSKIRGAGGASAQSMKELRDKLKGLEQTQKDVGRFRSLSKGLSDTSEKMKTAQLRADELATGIKNSANPTAKMRREFQQATRAAEDLKNKHGQQSQELQRLRSSLSSAGVSTKSLSRDERALRSDIAQTTSQLESQRKKLAQVAEQQRKLGEARQKMERVQSMAGSMAATGAAGFATGSGALYAGARFMSTGMNFDESMSKVQSLTRLDGDSEEMKALREQARRLGAETSFSATEAAAGQGFFAMAGFNPKEIMDVMPGTLDLAKAANMDLAETADISSNILSAMGMEASEMGKVGDILTSTFTSTNTSLYSLGETMKYAAPIAASAGVNLETLATMAGKLGDAGIQGSMAGTALNAIVGRLAKPPKEALEALEKIGVKAKDAAGNLRDPVAILEEIHEKTKDMGNADQLAILGAISGQEALKGMTTLTKVAGTGELREAIQGVKDDVGITEKTAAVMADNMVGDLESMKSAWEDFGIEIQSQQNGALRELVQRVTEIIRSIGAWTKENPELVARLVKVAAVVAALVAAGGALMMMLASILGPLAMMKYGMSVLTIKGSGLFSTLWGLGSKAVPLLLGGIKSLFTGIVAIGAKALPIIIGSIKSLSVALLTTPIGWAIMAIAAAAFLIWKYWEPLKALFSNLWEQVKAAFDGGIAGVTALLVNWSLLGIFYKIFSAALGYIGVELPDSLSEAGMKMILGLVNGINSLSNKLLESVLALWGQVKEAFNGGILGVSELIINWSPIGLFYQAFAAVLNYLGFELPGKFTEFGSMMMSGLVNGIKSMAGAVKKSIVGIGESTMGWFKDKLGIQSPSRVFMGFGENISEGAAIGIENKGILANKAMQSMAVGLLSTAALIPADVAASAAGSLGGIGLSVPEIQAEVQKIQLPTMPEVVNELSVSAPAVQVDAPQIQLPPVPEVANTLNVAAPLVYTEVPQIQLPAMPEVVNELSVSAPAVQVDAPQIQLPPVPEVVSTLNVEAPIIHVNVSQAQLPQLNFEQPRFDNRPPITAQQIHNQSYSQQANQYQNHAGDKIEIHIHAAQGQNEADIARAVAAELDRRERERKARRRSGLSDY